MKFRTHHVIAAIFFSAIFLPSSWVLAYGECSEYGLMATYDYLNDSCKCISGYVFKDDFLGKPQCVSADSVCTDKLGYGARYDSLYERCECRVGYVVGTDSIGRTQCITEDDACKNQLGSNARSTYGDKCECRYGYVINGGRCVDGNSLCYTKHGLNSEYDSVNNRCTCDEGYTFDDSGQCVEKQNNVYFTLKELDTDEKRAIIKSDYDYRYYLISYNSGCYSSSFRRYLRQQIVVNLGTDFDLDAWDKIVLQDDDEVCDITRVERADSSTTLEPEEDDEGVFFVPTPISVTPKIINTSPVATAPRVESSQSVESPVTKNNDFDVSSSEVIPFSSKQKLRTSASFRKCPSTQCSLIRYYAEGSELNISGKYKDGEWYQIQGTTDAGGSGQKVIGWIHRSLFIPVIVEDENKEGGMLDSGSGTSTTLDLTSFQSAEDHEKEKVIPKPKVSAWKRIIGWFKFWD